MSAHDYLREVVDPESFESWDLPVTLPEDVDYAAAASRARARTGVDESVVTGRARIGGHGVAVVVGEFGFLGGSVGQATVNRIVRALRRARDERLPVLAAPASGGTRMQEGTPAFAGMLDLTAAVVELKEAGLPYIVHLRHPTTGGVLASWGSLGHVTWAEPRALVGFLGPGVYRALHGRSFPDHVQTAENLERCGIVDGVRSAGEVRREVAVLLDHVTASIPPSTGVLDDWVPGPSYDGWKSICLSEEPGRPGARELLAWQASDVVPLSGTGEGEPGDRLLACIATLAGTSCLVIAQDRRAQQELGPLGPGDLRAARRLVRLADDLRLPLVTVVDTPGADLSVAAEEGALAGEMARLLADLSVRRVPSVAVLLGQGCGGAALAMMSADRVVAAENSWLSPLPLAGASTILHGHPDCAPTLALAQRVGAAHLRADGIVDIVVAEPRPAHEQPGAFCADIAAAVVHALAEQVSWASI